MPFKAKQTQITEVTNPPIELKPFYILLSVNIAASIGAIIMALGIVYGVF